MRRLVFLTLALTACAEPGHLELKLAHSAPPESLIAISADEFARIANQRLAGRATVVVYGSAQLGDDREIERTLFWPELAPLAEREGYRVLALWENGFRHVTNSVRPIVSPADLDGMKIRTPNSPWRIALFRAWGANPSPMPFSEVFMALQTGVMDGQENPLTNIATASFDDVQPFLSLTGHVYSPAYLIVAPNAWDRLPEDVRELLAAVARDTQAFVFEAARAIDERLLTELAASGMQINEVDRDAFVRESAPVYDDFGAQVPGGRAWIERALALADEGSR